MEPETLKYAAIMLAAGFGIPLLAGLNSALGIRLGNPAAAAVLLFLVALGATIVVFLLTGARGFENLAGTPKHLFLAGFLVAFYVLSVTWIAPRFGVGNAIFFVLAGQLLSAALIDHFGLFGAEQTSLTMTRSGGILVMLLGIFLTQKG